MSSGYIRKQFEDSVDSREAWRTPKLRKTVTPKQKQIGKTTKFQFKSNDMTTTKKLAQKKKTASLCGQKLYFKVRYSARHWMINYRGTCLV